jgi:hypothetical protein
MKGKEKKEKRKRKYANVCCVDGEHTGVVFERRKHVRVSDDIPVWALIHTTGRITLEFRSSVPSIQFAIRKSSMYERTRLVTIQGIF